MYSLRPTLCLDLQDRFKRRVIRIFIWDGRSIYNVRPNSHLDLILADGKKLIHQVDLEFERSTLSHEIGVTKRLNIYKIYVQLVIYILVMITFCLCSFLFWMSFFCRYNVIMDLPLIVDLNRVLKGGP